ncbi:MAG: NADH-quinone oxidoreductase subunit J [Chloroflexi bacterium]|nr:NADH-quinone oxidoreductase subunit J [Chloroflexota bacterium]
MESIPFYFLAALAVLAALGVVVMRDPVYSALALAVVLTALAGLYVLLSAPFLAAAQVMIYAGAILILFVFVIMLLSPGREGDAPRGALKWQRPLAVIFGGALVAQLALVLLMTILPTGRGLYTPEYLAQIGSTQAVGAALFTDYLLPFEITSLLLLVAMVGVIVLAKKKS